MEKERLGRKLEDVEIALCELYDILYKEGEVGKANEIAHYSRTISKWRNEKWVTKNTISVTIGETLISLNVAETVNEIPLQKRRLAEKNLDMGWMKNEDNALS